jgi:protein-tyrosine phosphatase
MMMLDFHTHILPQMDDGAGSRDEAAALIQALIHQGITTAVLTPHYYPFKESLPAFLERRMWSYSSLGNCELNLILGSETYLCESLFCYDSISELAIERTGFLLLELPYTEPWGSDLFKQLRRIRSKYNLTPVIAHVERYGHVRQKRERVLQELVDLGCLLQLNIDSVIDRKSRSLALRMLKGGWVDFVGSDCHSMKERPPRFDLFRRILARKLHTDAMNGSLPLTENAWDAFSCEQLTGKEPVSIETEVRV